MTVLSVDISRPPTTAQVKKITEWLAKADYRVVRPLIPRDEFPSAPRSEKLITVAILDTETTGLDPAKDRIIELGIVLVEISPETGYAFRVLHTFNQLEDPGMPIPPESTSIHHITDDMVAAKVIDDDAVEQLMSDVSLVIAHNANFDRPFVEQRFPIFCDKAWACSFQQVPWSEEGFGSAKLEYLAYRSGFHYAGHRAAMDCHALLEVLQQPLPSSGRLAMQSLLQNSGEEDVRISALGSPFESKDVLRERGYRWNIEKRFWTRSVQLNNLADEVAWIKGAVYGGQPFRLEQEKLSALNRYSKRQVATDTVYYE